MIAFINNGQKRREPPATPATTYRLLPSLYFLVFVIRYTATSHFGLKFM